MDGVDMDLEINEMSSKIHIVILWSNKQSNYESSTGSNLRAFFRQRFVDERLASFEILQTCIRLVHTCKEI